MWIFRILLLMGFANTCLAEVPLKTVKFLTCDYPPYTSLAQPEGGAMTKMIKEMLKPFGYEVEIDYLPWARVYVAKENYDAVLVLWPNEVSAMQLSDYLPLFKSRVGFFMRKGTSVDVTSFKTIGRHTIGITRKYGYPAELLTAGLPLDESSNDEISLRKLLAKRFDLVAMERAVGEYWLIRLHLEGQLVWAEPALKELPLGVAVVPGRPQAHQLALDLASALEQYKTNGAFDKVVKMFNVDSPYPDYSRLPPKARSHE